MKAPKVSAIVSTYNAERLIKRCIANLQAQTLGDSLEIIVIDSGSTENEAGQLKPVCEQDQRIVYQRTERETIYGAWNRALSLASGEYVINANTDDLSYPEAFAKMAEALDAHPECALVYTDYYLTTRSEDQLSASPEEPLPHWYRMVAPQFSHHELLLRCYCGPRPMWRRSLHAELGLFDAQFRYAGDYEFWLRIAEHYPMLPLDQALHLYFDNPSGLSNSLRGENEELGIRRKYLSMTP